MDSSDIVWTQSFVCTFTLHIHLDDESWNLSFMLDVFCTSSSTLCLTKMWTHFRWWFELELFVYKIFGTLITETTGNRCIYFPTSPICCSYFTVGNWRDV